MAFNGKTKPGLIVVGNGMVGHHFVKEAIRQLQSRIEFESAPGRGTTFRFLLTIQPDAPAEP